MYNDELRHYPSDLLAKLCDYFECGIEGILIYEKEPPQE
ncbi:helix-turn-helix domain-containing protein [Paenibacillus rhizoplanae]|uniref:Helix-turn-helix domain-containing protein n=1 Tax=Paenibacillus rhizoplanae TaxID=1917181 RepID=A0ABW5FCD1_9BACL